MAGWLQCGGRRQGRIWRLSDCFTGRPRRTIRRVTIELRAAGSRAVFEPAFGGRLHQLFVEVEGREVALLHSPEDPAAYGNDPLTGGCYPMAPWPNRLRDGLFMWNGERVAVPNGRKHALHGLVLDRPWEVVARVGRVLEMACAFGERWPWEGRAWLRFELGPDFLAMKMEVRAAREAFPAGCGWHPWFRRALGNTKGGRDSEVRVRLPARRRYELEAGLPTGRVMDVAGDLLLDGSPLGDRRLDDCYTELGAPIVVEWPGLRLTMTVECAFPHVQVYSPPEAFCIEPQTCAPDAFNLPDVSAGAAVAAPGRPLAIASRWTWEANP